MCDVKGEVIGVFASPTRIMELQDSSVSLQQGQYHRLKRKLETLSASRAVNLRCMSRVGFKSSVFEKLYHGDATDGEEGAPMGKEP